VRRGRFAPVPSLTRDYVDEYAMKHLPALIAALVLFVAGPSAAYAQQPTQTEPLDALLADEFARAALSLLALPQTGDNDYPHALAATLLDQAVALDPENPQLWTFRR